MSRRILIFLTAAALFFSEMPRISAGEISWEKISGGIIDPEAVLVDPNDWSTIYLAAGGILYKTGDSGNTWRVILSIKGSDRSINFITSDPKHKESILVCAGSGLFYSRDNGQRWKRIFRGRNDLESNCSGVVVTDDGMYLGTKAGLFFSKDQGGAWNKVPELGNSKIISVNRAVNGPENIFIASTIGLFRVNNGCISRVYNFASSLENNDDDPEENEDEDSAANASFRVNYVSVAPEKSGAVYLATSKGVYKSLDLGGKWRKLPDYGLLSRDVGYILAADNEKLYALTKSEVFEFRDGRWFELSLRPQGKYFKSIAIDNNNDLYLLSKDGLFKSKKEIVRQEAEFKPADQDEPGINEVQKAAIEFADVDIAKIRLWRKQAANKAWLPEMSLGVNRDITDLWHWETGSTTKNDDDTLKKGRDTLEWDITFSWDLGDLIWAESQTSIDVRSKLMVQLRDDVIDSVTKLYFERLRVKAEIDNLTIEDKAKRSEKELRLRELTAMLDGMTNGLFSRRQKSDRGLGT